MKKDTKNEIKDNELDKISGGYATQDQIPDELKNISELDVYHLTDDNGSLDTKSPPLIDDFGHADPLSSIKKGRRKYDPLKKRKGTESIK